MPSAIDIRSSPVTIDDVAKAAGVSIRTVSRVLNKASRVSPETRSRIEAAVADLGFERSWRARGLATGRSYLLGLVHNELNALLLDEVQGGAVDEAARRGYELVVHPTRFDAGDPTANAIDFARRSRVDGLLVMAPVSGIEGLPQALAAAGVPACALSAVHIDGYSSTLVYDERAGAAAAARHLIELGHRRIAFLSGPNFISSRERRAGFVGALEQAGLTLYGEARGDYGFESGVAGGSELLGLTPPPTAIFAANDIMAAGVMRTASGMGVAIPDELSVVGFDNSLLARMLTPPLTTVDRPMREIAEAAASRLIDLIEGRMRYKPFATALRLVVGASTGAFRHYNHR